MIIRDKCWTSTLVLTVTDSWQKCIHSACEAKMPRIAPTLIRPLQRSLYQSQSQSQHAIRTLRKFHPEPRNFISSQHATHRALYRWTLQAIGTPFLVAYLCEKVSERNDGGDSSWKLELPKIEAALLTEPLKIRTQVWGQI